MLNTEEMLAGTRAGEQFARAFPMNFTEIELGEIGTCATALLRAHAGRQGEREFTARELGVLACAVLALLQKRGIPPEDEGRFLTWFPNGYRTETVRIEWEAYVTSLSFERVESLPVPTSMSS